MGNRRQHDAPARAGCLTIGLLTHSAGGDYAVAIWRGVLDTLRAHDANLICFLSRYASIRSSSGRAQMYYDQVNPDNLDGLIIQAGSIHGLIGDDRLQASSSHYQSLPRVTIGGAMEGIPSILVDNYVGMYNLVTHFITTHHYRQIAYIDGHQRNPEARERYRAYTDALTRHGLPVDPALVVHGDFMMSAGKTAIHILFDQRKARLDAIVAANDYMALGALSALQARGIYVPDDVALAGFDDVRQSRTIAPSLTTVRQPLYEMGQQAALYMLRMCRGELPSETTIMPSKVVIRQSCGCLDPIIAQPFRSTLLTFETSFEATFHQQRQAILKELMDLNTAQALPGTSEKLLDAFVADVTQQTPGAFLSTFHALLLHGVVAHADIVIWYRALAVLHRYTLSCQIPKKKLGYVEELLLNARILIRDTEQRMCMHNSWQNEQRVLLLHELETDLAPPHTLPEVFSVLTERIPVLDIPGFYLVLYEEPGTPSQWARLHVASPKTEPSLSKSQEQRFLSHQLLPDGVLQTSEPYSLLVLPLYVMEEVFGFIVIDADPGDGVMYETLRLHIGSTLKRALLGQQVDYYAVQLQAAAEVSHAISSILDFDELLHQVVSLTTKRYALCACFVFLLNDEGTALVRAAGADFSGKSIGLDGITEILLEARPSIIALAARSKDVVLVNNTQNSQIHLPGPNYFDVRSELAIPIMLGDQLLGVFDLQSEYTGRFSDEDVRGVQLLAEQLAIAIQNAQLFAEAHRARQTAEIANLAKTEFLANMNHELRTPLSSIMGYVQILRRDDSLNAERAAEGLTIIQQCGEHLLMMIDDIMDLSKIEARRIELQPTVFHFPAFLEGVVNIIRMHAEQKQLTFVHEPLTALPERVQADEKRLRQILLNLLGNAVKFTHTGAVFFRIRVDNGIHASDPLPPPTSSLSHVHFEVEDQGTGIPADQLERIFLPFEQVGRFHYQSAGAGLGLSISRKLAQLMGSDIHVTSEIGKGSIFSFDVSLPVKSAPTYEIQGIGSPIIGYKGRRRRVLIADDEQYNRRFLKELLTSIGFLVEEAVNGEEAIIKAHEGFPDLVLMDLIMPGVSGFDAIQEIRRRPVGHHVVIITFSGNMSASKMVHSSLIRCDGFLPKPIDINTLFDALSSHLQVEWLYAEPRGVATTGTEETEILNVPALPELQQLYEMAGKGDMLGIREYVTLLDAANPALRAFTIKVDQLAQAYQDTHLLQFLEPYIKQPCSQSHDELL